MAVRKSQQKAVAKYMKNNYDEIKVRVQKGDRQKIAQYAEEKGMSLNAYIKDLIYKDIEDKEREEK